MPAHSQSVFGGRVKDMCVFWVVNNFGETGSEHLMTSVLRKKALAGLLQNSGKRLLSAQSSVVLGLCGQKNLQNKWEFCESNI